MIYFHFPRLFNFCCLEPHASKFSKVKIHIQINGMSKENEHYSTKPDKNYSGIHTPCPCGYLPSWRNFEDSVLKLCISCQFHPPKNKFQICGYLTFLPNLWIWALFIMFNKLNEFNKKFK